MTITEIREKIAHMEQHEHKYCALTFPLPKKWSGYGKIRTPFGLVEPVSSTGDGRFVGYVTLKQMKKTADRLEEALQQLSMDNDVNWKGDPVHKAPGRESPYEGDWPVKENMSTPTFENTKINGVSLTDSLETMGNKYLKETYDLEPGSMEFAIKQAIYEQGFRDAIEAVTQGQIKSTT